MPLALKHSNQINFYTQLRLRLARYFNKYPLDHKAVPAGIAEWALDHLIVGDYPEPWDIEVVARQKRDYLSMPLSTTAYCVNCDLVFTDLPVSVPNSIVHACSNCCNVDLTWRGINYYTYNPLHSVVI